MRGQHAAAHSSISSFPAFPASALCVTVGWACGPTFPHPQPQSGLSGSPSRPGCKEHINWFLCSQTPRIIVPRVTFSVGVSLRWGTAFSFFFFLTLANNDTVVDVLKHKHYQKSPQILRTTMKYLCTGRVVSNETRPAKSSGFNDIDSLIRSIQFTVPLACAGNQPFFATQQQSCIVRQLVSFFVSG